MNLSINRCVKRCTVVDALGVLLFGFDTAAIAGTTAALQFLPPDALDAGLSPNYSHLTTVRRLFELI